MSGARPCATCPWLRQNQTRAAIASSPKADGEKFRWYDVRNLKRLWRGYQTGHPTVCHSTDPSAEGYGGKSVESGHERICVGGLILCARAMDVVNKRAYQQKAGRAKPWTGLFTRDGMLYWLDMLMFRGTPLGMTTKQIPTEFDADAAKEVSVPWDDEVLNTDALPPLEESDERSRVRRDRGRNKAQLAAQ